MQKKKINKSKNVSVTIWLYSCNHLETDISWDDGMDKSEFGVVLEEEIGDGGWCHDCWRAGKIKKE